MPISPTDAKRVDQIQANLYLKHSLNNAYEVSSGRFALPVAENPPSDPVALADWSPVTVVYAHAPFRVRTAEWEMQKSRTPPLIPAPVDQGAFTFLSGDVYFHGPQLSPDTDGFTWTVAGSYAFVETVRHDYEDGYVLGSFPFENTFTKYAKNTFGTTTVPQFGAVPLAGDDVKAAYAEAQANIDFASPYGHTYYSTAFFPGQCQNIGVLNGDTYTTGLGTLATTVTPEA